VVLERRTYIYKHGPVGPIVPPRGRVAVLIHADEVIYHPDTEEIETRGDAKVMMEKPK
jgi:hypothetical protein